MLQAMVRDDSAEGMRRKRQPGGVCLNKITCSSLVERIQIQPDSVNRVLLGSRASASGFHACRRRNAPDAIHSPTFSISADKARSPVHGALTAWSAIRDRSIIGLDDRGRKQSS